MPVTVSLQHLQQQLYTLISELTRFSLLLLLLLLLPVSHTLLCVSHLPVITATLVDVVGSLALVTQSARSGVSLAINTLYLNPMPGACGESCGGATWSCRQPVPVLHLHVMCGDDIGALLPVLLT